MRSDSLKKDGSFSVAVLSDLHAFERSEKYDSSGNPSFYCIQDDVVSTPVGYLKKLIEENNLQTDILLCGGDLGDRANSSAIRAAWKEVNSIGELLGVHLIAGTVGNHDINSKYHENDFDAKGHLQVLSPPFPLPTESENDRFWSRNYEIIQHHTYQLVVLNSCAYHGMGENEYQHGRISEYTLNSLKKKLDTNTQKYEVNILLCHHHPTKLMEYDLGEYDEMKSGQLLIDLLGSGEYGNWIIIHGHKHFPKIRYSEGSNDAPVVFSAGSLCSTLYPEIGNASRQFYILEFPYSIYENTGFVGTFSSWDWSYGAGWKISDQNSKLPGKGGFGNRLSPSMLATRIKKWLNATGETFVKWEVFLDEFKEYKFLMPDDVRSLQRLLRENHQIEILSNDDMEPLQIGFQ